jgi:hypothetical protein
MFWQDFFSFLNIITDIVHGIQGIKNLATLNLIKSRPVFSLVKVFKK